MMLRNYSPYEESPADYADKRRKIIRDAMHAYAISAISAGKY